MSDWLADYHVVLVSRLTDPATSAGKANLTSQYLVEELQKKNLQTHEIKELSDKINTYRGKVVGLRNKRIAHIDLTEAMVPISGAHHPFGEVVEFHSNLDRFCFLVGDQLGAQHLSTIQIKEGFGGVTGFLMKLKRHFKDAP